MLKNDRTAFRNRCGTFMRAFARDEQGGIIVLTVLLLFTMLVVGGMAVDFMRYESERAELQSVSDRAVLAAAELDQTLDSKDVVRDFFTKAGYGSHIVGEPFAERVNGSREVRVRSVVDVNTFFLRLIGIDELTAVAESTAIEGTGNIEISLILDISGSMGNIVSVPDRSPNPSKMTLLQEAATAFIDDVLKPEYDGRVSINLIAYSQHVSLGDDLYKAIRTTPDTFGPGGVVGSSYAGEEDPGYTGGIDIATTFVNPTRCVDFLPRHFNELEFDTSHTYQQVERFEHYSGSSVSTITYPICPDKDFEGIIPLSKDAQVLKDAINDYRPTSFTSIHLGMKWGVALLDPSMRPILNNIDSIYSGFKGARPADYNNNSATVKYVVLMTDGQNVSGRRVEPDDYDTVEERRRWAEFPSRWWIANGQPSGSNLSFTGVSDPGTSAADQDTWLQQTCTLAKTRMTVFTIAMGAGAGSNGETQMTDCATSASTAFKTNFSTANGDQGIDEIFTAIARQITALRLSL